MLTVNARSLICILNDSSSLESTSSGRAMQSHHLQEDNVQMLHFVTIHKGILAYWQIDNEGKTITFHQVRGKKSLVTKI